MNERIRENPDARSEGNTSWLGQIVPLTLVLLALGGIGVAGHAVGWKISGISSLLSRDNSSKDDWCKEHLVTESECVECHPELLPRGPSYEWCKKHGVPECPLCHLDLAEVNGPRQFPKYDVTAALTLWPRLENNRNCKLHLRRIQFASQEAAKKAGIDDDTVQEMPMEETLAAHGELEYARGRVGRIAALVPGSIWRVETEVGKPVKKGDVLALVEAVEVGKAKADLLQALAQVDVRAKTLDSMREAHAQRAITDVRFRELEAAVREAQILLQKAQQTLVNLGMPVRAEELKGLTPEELGRRVQFLGLPDALSRALDPGQTPANLMPLRAPLDGVVVSLDVVAGEVVEAKRLLFVVADVSRLWLMVHVHQEEAKLLSLGQVARFRPDGSSEDSTGTVTWISTEVEEKTRTVKVRAELANPQGQLRVNVFGAAQIVLREEKNAVVVPNGAVQWDGSCYVVFVRDRDWLKETGPKVFHTRKVRIGAKNEKYTELLAGVLPGESVATKGSAVLRAELLKDTIGDG